MNHSTYEKNSQGIKEFSILKSYMYIVSLAPTNFSGAVFTSAHIQKIARTLSYWLKFLVRNNLFCWKIDFLSFKWYILLYPKSTLYTQTESASAQKSSWELVPFTYILQHTDSVRQPANDIYNNMSISNNGFHHPVCTYSWMWPGHSRISVHL